MSQSEWNVAARLEAGVERVGVRPVSSLTEALETLSEERSYWGMVLTPARARLAWKAGGTWKEVLREERALQARVFDERMDLHWREGRGVLLRILDETEGPVEEGEKTIGGDGWYRRERCMRLWGERLKGAGTWYEERIPAPQRYEGLDPGHRYALLRSVEYVTQGSVRHVRFLEVVGAAGDGKEDG
jgi:hypothetical protein